MDIGDESFIKIIGSGIVTKVDITSMLISKW